MKKLILVFVVAFIGLVSYTAVGINSPAGEEDRVEVKIQYLNGTISETTYSLADFVAQTFKNDGVLACTVSVGGCTTTAATCAAATAGSMACYCHTNSNSNACCYN